MYSETMTGSAVSADSQQLGGGHADIESTAVHTPEDAASSVDVGEGDPPVIVQYSTFPEWVTAVQNKELAIGKQVRSSPSYPVIAAASLKAGLDTLVHRCSMIGVCSAMATSSGRNAVARW